MRRNRRPQRPSRRLTLLIAKAASFARGAALAVLMTLPTATGAQTIQPVRTVVDCGVAGTAIPAEQLAPGWERSYRAGCPDPNGKLAAGSELLHLVAHKAKLYAAVGYWEDPRNPWYGGSSPNQGWAQILRLDDPAGRWNVDLDLGPQHLRAEILQSVTFSTDGTGRALPAPVSLLLASTFDGGNGQRGISLFTRDDATGKWTKSKIVAGPTAARGQDNSVRAMQVHRDTVTGVDRVFVSVGTPGVFSGVYDPSMPGKIKWDSSSETGMLPVRPLAIAEANGSLFFSADRVVYRRIDGAQPRYEAVADLGDRHPGTAVETVGGIRGLTAIPNPAGTGQSLLFAWEPDSRSRGCIFRLDPAASGRYSLVQEVCLDRLVSAYLHEANVPYVLAAYNQILPVADPSTNRMSYLVGIEAWVTGSRVPTVVRKGNGGMYRGALYAIRDSRGNYRISEVNGPALESNPALVAPRDYAVSPFPSDLGHTLYFGGFDCNWVQCSDTAWIFRTSITDALRDPSTHS